VVRPHHVPAEPVSCFVDATRPVVDGVEGAGTGQHGVTSSPQLTLGIYARATAEGDRNAADRLGEMVGPRHARAMHRRKQSFESSENRL
jgi:hypothetical protein